MPTNISITTGAPEASSALGRGTKPGVEPAGQPSPEPQPRMRNPVTLPDSSPEKQSELKLNVGIGILGTILSFACAVIFFVILDELALGIVFAVIGLIALAITLYVQGRRRRAMRNS